MIRLTFPGNVMDAAVQPRAGLDPNPTGLILPAGNFVGGSLIEQEENRQMKNQMVKALIFLIALSCKFVLAQSDEELIWATMKKWQQAIASQNIDAIVEYYSENFKSRDGNGKMGVRKMWQEIKEAGMLDKLVINLETARLEIDGDKAGFFIYNDEGEIDMDFTLSREDGQNWRITGIPSETCNYEQYKIPYGNDCLEQDGYFRCWDILVPPGLNGPAPLVIDLHGWEGSPARQRELSGFDSLAQSEGFIVVWPYGLCKSWNSGAQCCPPASDEKIDDVGFIRKLVDRVSDKYRVNKNRIYVTGLSNGCSMAQRLASEASDIITAVACMSLHLLVPKATDYTPIPVMTLLGNADDLYTASEDMPGAKENFDTWKKMNNCQGEFEVTWRSGNSVAWTYLDCQNNAEVTLVTIDGGGHILYKGEDTEINTTKLAWDFLKRFSKQ